jgi:nitrous oxidase accessory protein NosD
VTPGASLNVTVVDSMASNNNNVGINAFLANTVVMVRNSVASNNGTGLFAQRNAILRVAHSAVTGNFLGVQTTSGGTLFSYGDNDIAGNTNDNTGVLTPLAQH